MGIERKSWLGMVPSSKCGSASASVAGRAHMFFPAFSASCATRPSAACGQALTLAGESTNAKTGLLLQYAYNAALRGCRSLIFSRQRPSPEAPLPGPLPANEAALKHMVFKYVSCAQDIRKVLMELHQPEYAPHLIIITDDLSSLLGECDRSRQHQEGGETGADAELALTLARLVDALAFCDNCHSSDLKARSQATLETAAEASSRDEMEYGQTDHQTGSERETGAIQSEVLIAEGLSEAGLPKMLFVYEKFIPGYLTIRQREAGADGDMEMRHFNHRRCRSCGSTWQARFQASDGVVRDITFCC